MVAREVLTRYLAQAGVLELKPSAEGWSGLIEPGGQRLALTIRLSENWLLFKIPRIVRSPGSLPARQALHEQLLRQNRELQLAKFCLDDTGNVVLTLELPTESLNDSEVRDAVAALARTAEGLLAT
jgi:hypothetical protein